MSRPGRVAQLTLAVRTFWRELGGFGKVALAGLVISVGVAIVLGLGIPALVEDNLLEARVATLVGVTDDLVERDLIRVEGLTPGGLAELDEHVRLRLLGGDTVRVKLWQRGDSYTTIVYSDLELLQGQRFPISDELRQAFAGDAIVSQPALSLPENEFERDLSDLVEFYIPIPTASEETEYVFEVYQDASTMSATVASTQRTVWLLVVIVLAVLGAFMGSLIVANARLATRRAEQAERLVSELARAQDDERRHIVGALHDDVGQPLYRVLYGIQGARSQIEVDTPVAEELARLEDLLRNVDSTLKTELRILHHGAVEHFDLDTLVSELARKVEAETDLHVDLRFEDHSPLSTPMRTALFRAAGEAVTNARKHAKAESVSISVRDGNRRVLLEVEDDGLGGAHVPGLGLTTTKERLEAMGGGLTIVSRRGAGTLFRAWVPVTGSHET